MATKKSSGKKAATKKSSGNQGGGKKSASKSGAGKKAASKKSSGKKTASKRELIDTGTDKRYVRRDKEGQFKTSVDVGRSLSREAKQKTRAKTQVEKGQGDRGDQKQ
jgi:hypothetical protein